MGALHEQGADVYCHVFSLAAALGLKARPLDLGPLHVAVQFSLGQVANFHIQQAWHRGRREPRRRVNQAGKHLLESWLLGQGLHNVVVVRNIKGGRLRVIHKVALHGY